MDNENNQVWYMNMLSGSGVVKSPNVVQNGGKLRSMEDILGALPVKWKKPEQEQLAQGGENGALTSIIEENDSHMLISSLNTCNTNRGGRTQPGLSRTSWARVFADENVEMEKMTLKEMQHSLKKAIEKSLDIEGCFVSTTLPSRTNSHSISCPGSPLSVNTEVPAAGLELHLEDSTSNSAGSSDNVSPGDDTIGITSSFDTSGSLLNEASVQISKAGVVKGSISRKRKAFMGSATVVPAKTEVNEDDECTLQMWQQSYHKQHYCCKRSKKHSELQQKLPESLGKVGPDGSSSILDASATCFVISVPEVDKYQMESSPSTSLGHALPENVVVEDSGKTDVHLLSAGEPNEGTGYYKDKLSTAKSSSHDEDSSKTLVTPLTHSTVRLELEDELDIGTSKPLPERLQTGNLGTWALKPCSKTLSATLSKSAPSQIRVVRKPNSQNPSWKACDLSDLRQGQEHVKLIGHEKTPKIIVTRDIQKNPSPTGAASAEQSGPAMELHDRNGVCKLPMDSSRELIESEQRYRSPKDFPEDHISSRTDSLKQSIDSFRRVNSEGLSELPAGLNAIESFEIEEDQECQQKPAKIPCKRKAISPFSQEKLLQASKLGEFGYNLENRVIVGSPSRKRLPHFFKGFIGQNSFNEKWVDVFSRKKGEIGSEPFGATEKAGQREEALPGSPCHNQQKPLFWKPLKSKASSPTPSSSDKHVAGPTAIAFQQTPSHAQKLSLVLHTSPSPPPQEPSKAANGTSPIGSSIPTKGILRSTSQACQGPCRCEGCVSVRSRAERASEFSQRQMQDIEGIAVKLMKDLSILRGIVEDRLIQSSVKQRSPHSVLSLAQLKMATGNAIETEETAKKWLVRMARDCNRYCKIMRMQERKLTFADEMGGQLCHVKVFHSQATTEPHTLPVEASRSILSTDDELAIDAA